MPSVSTDGEAVIGDNVGTPQSEASTVEYFQTPQRSHISMPSVSANSSTGQHASALTQSGGTTSSYESSYEMDPDYSGPLPQSQPCDKHGVKYVPAGMRRVYVKKRKLEFDSPNN